MSGYPHHVPTPRNLSQVIGDPAAEIALMMDPWQAWNLALLLRNLTPDVASALATAAATVDPSLAPGEVAP